MRAALLAMMISVLFATSGRAGHSVFRLTDLDLRDPHFYYDVPFIGCQDITDVGPFGTPSYNEQVHDAMNADGDGDGFLDLSFLLVFDPLDQGAPAGEVTFQRGRCTAPAAGTSCAGDPEHPAPYPLPLTNSSSGTCLAPVPGRLYGPYSPEVVSSGAPCFVTSPSTWSFDMAAGAEVSLESAQVAARYVGDPADSLTDGLIVGFLRKSTADTTFISDGSTLGSHLPGGTGSCRSGTGVLDLGPDGVTPGWWMHWNFTARKVAFPGETAVGLSGPPQAGAELVIGVPNPFRGETSVSFTVRAAGRVRVLVHDAAGRRVGELVDSILEAGRHSATWTARDAEGRPLPAGVYFVRLDTPGAAETAKVLLAP